MQQQWDTEPAAVLNQTDAVLARWMSSSWEIPFGMSIREDEVARTLRMFRQIEKAAREAAAGGIRSETSNALAKILEDLLGDGVHFYPAVGTVDPTRETGDRDRPLPLKWEAGYERASQAETAPHVWTKIILLLEMLSGKTRWRFAVCKAPHPEDCSKACDRIFVTQRQHATYCSATCRKRAQRLRDGVLR